MYILVMFDLALELYTNRVVSNFTWKMRRRRFDFNCFFFFLFMFCNATYSCRELSEQTCRT